MLFRSLGVAIAAKFCGSSKGSKFELGIKSKSCNYAKTLTTNNPDDLQAVQFIPVDGKIDHIKDGLFYREWKGDCNIVPSAHMPNKSCGASTCSPPRYGPNGCHIPSPKHGPHPQGNVASGLNMEDGQKALDESVPVKSKKQRVAVWKGQFIVFEPTQLGKTDAETIWHNHIRN